MSKRNYISQAELDDYANLSISDSGEIDLLISQSEEQIDAYVGPQERFLSNKRRVFGVATAADSSELTDTSSDSDLTAQKDGYFTYCTVSITGGTGEGQRRRITDSDKDAGTITVDTAWTTPPDNTSAYRIVQIGKFPRSRDCFYNSDNDRWYKSIPENVIRATAAQVEYADKLGESFFATDKTTKNSETISDYSYSRGGGSGGNAVDQKAILIAPKARNLLKGIMSRIGRMVG